MTTMRARLTGAVLATAVAATTSLLVMTAPIAAAAGPTTIAGVVTDSSTGAPVGGVEVDVVIGSSLQAGATTVASAVTDASGGYSIPLAGLASAADPVTVDLVDPAGAFGVSYSNGVTLVDDDTVFAPFALDPGAVVSGTVTGAGGGALAGSCVTVRDGATRLVVPAGGTGSCSDAAGAYSLPALAAGTYTFTFSSPDLALWNSIPAQQVTVSAGVPAVADATLMPVRPTSITGVVTELGTSTPLAGIEVTATTTDAAGTAQTLTATTDATGAFTLAIGFQPGAPFVIDVVDPTGAHHPANGITISVQAGYTEAIGVTLQPSDLIPTTNVSLFAPQALIIDGQPGSASIVVRNAGPTAAADVVLTATLPLFATAGDVEAPAGFSCTVAGQVVTCSSPVLGVQREATIRIPLTTGPAPLFGFIQYAVTTSSVETNTFDNSAFQFLPVQPNRADVRLLLDTRKLEVGVSAPVTLGVINFGPATATDVFAAARFPVGLTVDRVESPGWSCAIDGQEVGCSASSLAPESGPLEALVYVTPTTLATGLPVSAIAGFAGIATDAVDGTVDIVPVGSVDLTVFALPIFRPTVVGRVTTLDFSVLNFGPAAATDLVFASEIPAGLEVVSAVDAAGAMSCSIIGQQVTCTSANFPRTVSANVKIGVRPTVEGGPFSVSASLTSSSVDIGTQPDTTTMPDFVAIRDEADLSVSLFAPALAVGEVGTVSINVGNLGPAVATDVEISAVVPDGFSVVSASPSFFNATCSIAIRSVTCRVPELSPNGFPFTLVQLRVLPASAASGEMTASVSSPSTDPNPADNTAAATLNAVAPGADLRVSVSPFGSTAVGQTGTLFVTVNNDGPSFANGATVTVTVPEPFRLTGGGLGATCTITDHIASCDFGSFPPAAGTSVFLSYVADVAGQVSATSVVSSLTPDPDPSDNEASSILFAPAPSADLAVFVPFSPTPFAAGEPNERTITVQNQSFDAASDAVLTVSATGAVVSAITAPGFDCSVEPDGTGRCVTASFGPFQFVAATVSVVPADGAATVDIAATVSAATDDPFLFNNASSTSVEVVPAGTADLVARLAVGDTTFTLGVQRDVTIGVSNLGPARVGLATYRFDVPSAFEIVRVEAGPGSTCVIEGAQIACEVPDLASGAEAGATVTLLPTIETFTVPSVLVGGATSDPNPFNNQGFSFVSVVRNESDLSVAISSQDLASVGSEVLVQVSVNSFGPASASDVTLRVTFPPELALVEPSLPSGCAQLTVGVVTCSYASVQRFVGEFLPLPFTAVAETGAAVVTASVTAATPDPFTFNNEFSTTVAVAPEGAVDMRVESPPFIFDAEIGRQRDVILSAQHVGPSTSAATDVHLRATFPAEVRIDSAEPWFVPSSGSCTVDANVVDCVFPSVAAFSFATVLVRITPVAATTAGSISVGVSSATFDPRPGNNDATGFLQVLPDDSNLFFSYFFNDLLIEGDSAQEHLFVFNAGPSTSRNTTLRIEPGAGVVVTDPTVPGAATPCEADGAAWNCSLPDVSRSSDAHLVFTLTGVAVGETSVTFTAAADNQVAPGSVSLTLPVRVAPVGTADLAVSVSSFSTDSSGGQSVFVSYGQSGPTLEVDDVELRIETPGLLPSDVLTFGSDVTCVPEPDVLICTIPRLARFSGGSLSFRTTPIRDEFDAQIVATITGPGFDPFLDNNASRSFTYDARVTPSAPTIVYVQPRDSAVEMGLASPQLRNEGIVDYVVEYSTDGGSTWQVGTDPGPSDETPIGFNVTGLTNGVSHVFRVAAVNAFGRGDWSEVSAPVTPSLPPRTPAKPEARAGNQQVTLSWQAPSQRGRNPIVDYVIQYSSDRGRTWTTFDDGVSAGTRAVVTGLTNGTRYTFRVAAVNDAGQSRFSDESNAVTPRRR